MNWHVIGASRRATPDGPIELLVAERPNRGRGRRAVLPEQIQGCLFRHRDRGPWRARHSSLDVVHRHARDRLATGQCLCQLNLDRVDARDVMHDDADLTAVLGNAGLPLRVGEGARERRQCVGARSSRSASAWARRLTEGEPSRLTAGAPDISFGIAVPFGFRRGSIAPACSQPYREVRDQSYPKLERSSRASRDACGGTRHLC